MDLKIYNSLSRKIEEFKPLRSPKVAMYTCGPTVYDYAHLGNLRTYILSDILRRVLIYSGYQVKAVMNITDVGHLTSDADEGEDKLEKGARREGKSAWQIAAKYTQIFLADIEKLNILRPDILCQATDHIKEQIDLIKKLEVKGYTYQTSDGLYYDTSRFADYGRLARLDLQGLKPGARVELNREKRNPQDFALWKFSPTDKKREMEWDSPWGKGFPGWHIECSAMSMKYLGKTLDLHLGGIDLLPVHHTNEVAQSEAATGQKFVNYWVHGEFLLVEGQKMSKSKGNFYNLRDMEKKGFDPLAFRYLCLLTHYRQKMNFTWEALKAAQQALHKLQQQAGQWGEPKIGCAEFEEKFLKAVSNDLNLPAALAIVWRLVKSAYPPSAKKASLLKFDQVLGLGLERAKKVKITRELEKLILKRESLRKEKKWAEADKIRKKIEARGFVIEDTSQGAKLRPAK